MAHARHVIACVVGLALGLVRTADAHPLDLGYLTVEAAGERVDVRLELDAAAAAILLGIDAAKLDAATVERSADPLARSSYARAAITSAAGACTWEPPHATLAGRTVSISGQAHCPAPDGLRWTFPMVTDSAISPSFQLMVKETVAGSERLTLVDRDAPELELASSSATFGRFVWSGIEHIGVAPGQWRGADGGPQLPDGIDHILFLLALMLGGGRLLQLVGIASGFTLGHSITLALAALDVIRPPASIIEPLIALSIALAAAEAFTGKLAERRWQLATVFGLVHGFGFAAALSHFDGAGGTLVALFGYNLGVELGQVALVLVFAPLVILLHRRVPHGPLVLRIIASALFVCGMWWFVTRLLG